MPNLADVHHAALGMSPAVYPRPAPLGTKARVLRAGLTQAVFSADVHHALVLSELLGRHAGFVVANDAVLPSMRVQ